MVKCELIHDNFQNFKRYNIPSKAQLREMLLLTPWLALGRLCRRLLNWVDPLMDLRQTSSSTPTQNMPCFKAVQE